MWPIIGIVLAAIGIAIYEVPSMIKRNLKKELWVFSVLLIIGVTLSIIESLNVEIPNPMDWLTIIYKPFSDIFLRILK